MRTRRYFNPLPRKEGDAEKPLEFASIAISIHSLVKRETKQNAVVSWLNLISIHSLVKRETGAVSATDYNSNYFNPLPRKEGDVYLYCDTDESVHFNPLPRKEGDTM